MVAITIVDVTDPINVSNVTAVTASGTTDSNANTVTVTIVDSTGASVGPISAIVAALTWSIPATNVSTLADGVLIYEATADNGLGTTAFAAASGTKQGKLYITNAELRAHMRDQSTLDNAVITDAISSASRDVDAICGRYFYQQIETQYYFPCDYWTVDLGDMDIATTTGLTVATDDGTAGTYANTLTINTDFILEPRNQSSNGINPWPYEYIRAINARFFPVHLTPWQLQTVKVVATFGWPGGVPAPVKMATKILGAQSYAIGGAPLGVAGWGAWGDIRVRDIPVIANLLRPYARSAGYGVA